MDKAYEVQFAMSPEPPQQEEEETTAAAEGWDSCYFIIFKSTVESLNH